MPPDVAIAIPDDHENMSAIQCGSGRGADPRSQSTSTTESVLARPGRHLVVVGVNIDARWASVQGREQAASLPALLLGWPNINRCASHRSGGSELVPPEGP